jgi:hypothetical protein
MTTNRSVHPFEPSGQRREFVRLVRQIQTLTLELRELQRREQDTSDVDAKERTLEKLRWRLATVVRRTATDDLGAAA